MRPGQTLKIGWFICVDPSCRSPGPMTVDLIEPPEKGRILVEQGPEYTSSPPGNPRSACNERKNSATRPIYGAPPGPADDDRFTIEIVDCLGDARRVDDHVALH
ncbi:hypothetical protein QR78_20010 [Methylobacterium indicum]|uniref:Uncharacterized protein n=2 Tax=Methylobacterium indicum TaxID=1775910 RepID=A0ABR5HCS8_9HYPH|nr:hypothetical protein QR78_20010 [Methylobacterium indicum]KMO23459.1 hypothetical protein QR79_13435 [Methylobacterium indicum]